MRTEETQFMTRYEPVFCLARSHRVGLATRVSYVVLLVSAVIKLIAIHGLLWSLLCPSVPLIACGTHSTVRYILYTACNNHSTPSKILLYCL